MDPLFFKSLRLRKQFVYKRDTLLLEDPLDSSHDVNIFRFSEEDESGAEEHEESQKGKEISHLD